jgi:translocation and assembly module TamA
MSSCRFAVLLSAGWLAFAGPMARAQTPPAEQETPLDPTAPLADLPDIGVAWPDLATAPTDPTLTTGPQRAGGEFRYNYRITGIDGINNDLFRQRFNELSTLRAKEGEPSNAAQIDRRAREDARLLDDLLRNEGYFDARITTSVRPEGDRLIVYLEVEPGQLYRFAQIRTPGIAAAGDKAADLSTAFGLKPEAPVQGDTVVAAQGKLETTIGREGFPFAKVGEPQITVDHATRTATIEVDVQPGGERRFGRIVARPNRVFDGDHAQDIARFKPGETYDSAMVDDLRRAIVQTSLVSQVRLTPVEGQAPGIVDLDLAMEPAPPRTIAGEIGYGTGEGARVEASWTHRNLFPPEGALTLRGVLGTLEQVAAVTFRRNNFHGRDRVLTAQVAATHLVRNAFEANTVSLSAGLERQTNIFFQKTWTWALGGELVATDERDVIVATGEPRRRTYFIGALPSSLNYDGSDDLLNPTKGFRLGGRISPELSLRGDLFGYTRAQVDASVYRPVTSRVVLAARTRIGSILGAPRDAVAPSRRFYAGGGASVRGYGFQDIGPRDPNNDPIGGRSLAEFSLEARVKAFGNFGVVPFLDAGNIYTSTMPKFSGLRYGAGIGVRYYSNFGPIRVDVGTPINPQKGDPRIAVYVSLGQAF